MTQKNKNRTRIDADFLTPIDAFEMNGHKIISAKKHPAMLSEEDLLKEVVLNFGRTGGPGGQHRNRKATACTATHTPSDVSGEATERRKQSENRKLSISRLRRRLAIQLRRDVKPSSFKSSSLWEERRNGDQFPINPKHHDYPHVLAEALDVLLACEFDQVKAADVLQISPTQFIKLVGHDKAALTWVNNQRTNRGLCTLKA